MTAARLGESARYGLRLYGYVLGITLLGLAGVAGGALLAVPEVQAWRGPGQAEVATGAAGGVLLFLGLSILAVGWLSTAYKLLADGVARGLEGPDSADSEPEPEPSGSETVVPGPDPEVNAPEPDSEPEPATVDPAGADSPAASEPAQDTEADPPEPSPEEIAFGSSGDEESEPDPEPVDEPEASTSSSGRLPGQNASSDPLADPGDE